MSNFNIEQSEVELESTFTPRLWTLVHDVPVLYEALLDKLGHVGLSTSDLRSDVGYGSVGNAGLTFWLYGANARVRIGLDQLQFRTRVLTSDILHSVNEVIAAIREASPELRFRTHTVSYTCHGLIEGIRAAEFVRHFVTREPTIEGFGDHLGAGAVFYYGEAPPVISSTLTVDVSHSVPDGLFARVLMVVDGTVGTDVELQPMVENQVKVALASVDLQMP